MTLTLIRLSLAIQVANPSVGGFSTLGMTYVAAVLRSNNIPVDILDPISEGHTFDSALEHAKQYDVIIIVLAASNAQGTYKFFGRLKDKTRIFMGTHATALAEQILKKRLVRYYCTGGAGIHHAGNDPNSR